jgi:CRISP-associated protein Cas1
MGGAGAQRQLRQFEGLYSEGRRHELAKPLVRCKVPAQLRFLLRASRGQRTAELAAGIRDVRAMLRRITATDTADELRGVEGAAASAYFAALPGLVAAQASRELAPSVRTRQPARDRFSALLNYAYGMLYRQVLTAIIAVGLHSGVGFFHRP